MEMKFKIEECPLQLWFAEYNKSISEYKEAKFTKAPWKIQDDGYGLIGVLFRKGYGVLVGHKDNESISNANLIAAAPEMYELLEFISENPSETNVIEIRKLLAKARGGHV